MCCQEIKADLEEAGSIFFTQVYVDHLEKGLDLLIWHLAIMVHVSLFQVAIDPDESSQGYKQIKKQS